MSFLTTKERERTRNQNKTSSCGDAETEAHNESEAIKPCTQMRTRLNPHSKATTRGLAARFIDGVAGFSSR